jgi:AraC-like DNA-binding protein
MSEPHSDSHAVLDHLLAALDVGVTRFTTCDIRQGWRANFDPCETASLHYCLSGTGALAARGMPPVPLEPHTFVLLPPGVPYGIESAGSATAHQDHRRRFQHSPSRESVPTVMVGTGGNGVLTACGEVRFGIEKMADPFLPLGRPLVVRFDGVDGLRDQFVMLLAESTRPRVGSRVLTEALLKLCLVLALRRHIESGDATLPWLAGVADARLNRALRVIFEQPEAPLTVERLAAIAGMSRSAFAAAFARVFDQSPMNLVKLVRLRRAAELLAVTSLPVAEVARRVGFSSRSNFSQAFTRLHGVDPTGFRRASASGGNAGHR